MIGAAFNMPVFSRASTRIITAGYSYRRRIMIPSGIHRLSNEDGAIVIPFLETENWLKSVANGGKVQSSSGFDIRFENDNGTKLAHDLATYVPTTGRVEAWVRIPTVGANQHVSFFLLYGNATQATNEANAGATWSGYRWALDVATGQDASASIAHVENTEVAATTLLGMDAGAFTV